LFAGFVQADISNTAFHVMTTSWIAQPDAIVRFASAQRLIEARRTQQFTDPQDLALRARLNKKELEALAGAYAPARLPAIDIKPHGRLAGIDTDLSLFATTAANDPTPMLRVPTETQNIAADYSSAGLTLRRHPLALRMRFSTNHYGSQRNASGSASPLDWTRR
jgi:hypothetical protein